MPTCFIFPSKNCENSAVPPISQVSNPESNVFDVEDVPADEPFI